MRIAQLIVPLLLLLSTPMLGGDSLPPPCPMQPAHPFFSLPKQGFIWFPRADQGALCTDLPSTGWIHRSCGNRELFVHAKGPWGSMREWEITVGIGSRGGSRPRRGFCLMTSTVGWRAFQHEDVRSLQWLDDLDSDGRAELILWASFPLHDDATLPEHGLVGWVYSLTSTDSLLLNRELTRELARTLAEEYRSGTDSRSGIAGVRMGAAAALESFARDGCTIIPVGR